MIFRNDLHPVSYCLKLETRRSSISVLLFKQLKCLRRLAGDALVVPFVNYWWSCYPAKLSKEALGKMLAQDQRTFRVVHYAPWLVHWWMNQKWFRALSITEGNMAIFSPPDLEIVKKLSGAPSPGQVNDSHFRFR